MNQFVLSFFYSVIRFLRPKVNKKVNKEMNHQFSFGMWNSMGGQPMMGQPMMGQPMMGQFIGDMNVKLIRGLNIFAMQDKIVIEKLKRNHT